jgi:hypothetical protein
MRLTNLYVWRDVCSAYVPLESFLSTQEIADECIVCIDPDFPEDVKLAGALAEKFLKVRVVHFRWPVGVPGDGSRIGIASQFALAQASGNFVLNVQADEIYSRSLTQWLTGNWESIARRGYECFSLKVLNLEHNMQQYQGGNETSTWDRQSGAGYNRAIKLFRRCPKIKFAPDAWSMDGCIPALTHHIAFSEQFPIVHCHDNFRDTLIQLRKTAAEEIWTDRVKYGHYLDFAQKTEASKEAWWNDPKWTNPHSPYEYLLPDFVKPLIGQTSYRVRWELLA